VACGTEDFIQYLNLKDAIDLQNERIKAENDKVIEVSSLKHFFSDIEILKGKFSKSNASEKGSRKMRVFISYARADNENKLADLFVTELRSQLTALKDDYEFEIFKDEQILMGE